MVQKVRDRWPLSVVEEEGKVNVQMGYGGLLDVYRGSMG